MAPSSVSQVQHQLGWSKLDLEVHDPVFTGSGNRDFDRALGRQLVRLSKTFGVTPGFAFADDFRGQNALATTFTRFAGTNGTILFGLRFMKGILNRGEGGDIAMLGVCAHEFAHIAQFFRGSGLDQSSSRMFELHADFLAGWFIGQIKQMRPHVITRVFEESFKSFGSTGADESLTHGRSHERIDAVRSGMAHAARAATFSTANTWGAQYVLARYR